MRRAIVPLLLAFCLPLLLVAPARAQVRMEPKPQAPASSALSAPTPAQTAALVVQQFQGRRIALVIGNGDYHERYFSPLANPVNDARDMAAALRKLGFEVTLRQNVGKREMEDAIRALGTQLKKGGVGLFYFAGHGMQFQSRNFLIPVRANILGHADLEYEAVNAERVLSEMSVAENGFNIVILDACRANAEFPGAGRGSGTGLAEMRAPTGSLIAYATSPGSFAADGAGRNGTYTGSLLRRMATPGLPVELLFKQVRADVAKATNSQQIPWEHSSLIGDFAFAGTAASPAAAPALAASAPFSQQSGPQAAQPGQQALARPTALALLGLGLMELTPEAASTAGYSGTKGVLVAGASPGGAAEKAGLRKGDIVLEAKGRQLKTSVELVGLVALAQPGERFPLTVWRQGKTMAVACVLGERTVDAYEAHILRGNGLHALGDYQRAIEEFSQALALKPDEPVAYYNRGNSYGSLRQHQRAIEDYTQTITLKPDYVNAYNNRGNVYSALGQYQRAVEDYNQALALNPESYEAYTNRGNAFQNLGQYERAVADLTQALALMPGLAVAYGDRAFAYKGLGRLDEAKADARRALELDPKAAVPKF